jgi:hypothetical protein
LVSGCVRYGGERGRVRGEREREKERGIYIKGEREGER